VRTAPRWQVVPPSPPYHVYEVIVFSSSLASTFGCFAFCCLCCILCGRGYDRDRATSRMLGTGPERVDGMGWIGGAGRSKAGGSPSLFGPYPADVPAHGRPHTNAAAAQVAPAVRFALGDAGMTTRSGASRARRAARGGMQADFAPLSSR